MPTTTANFIAVHYEDHCDPSHPALLMIQGLGAQMTLWLDELGEALVACGLLVIRFDNRDIGLSEKMGGAKVPSILKMVVRNKLGLKIQSPARRAHARHPRRGRSVGSLRRRAHHRRLYPGRGAQDLSRHGSRSPARTDRRLGRRHCGSCVHVRLAGRTVSGRAGQRAAT